MGSGSRFTFGRVDGFGAGFSISRFPFALTFNAHALFWYVSVGFGRGYDEPEGPGFWSKVWHR
jgi:hypothetical protein